MRQIKKLIHIDAPKEKVWDVLLGSDTFPVWASAFSPGTHVTTDWQEDSPAVFLDSTDSGVVSRIASHVPNDHITIEHMGIVAGGKEDFDSEDAMAWRGLKESYFVSETDDITTLIVESDTVDAYFDDADAQWDAAILLIKDLAEKK
jgi:hypothetical protein